jgi:hypothetical protein
MQGNAQTMILQMLQKIRWAFGHNHPIGAGIQVIIKARDGNAHTGTAQHPAQIGVFKGP